MGIGLKLKSAYYFLEDKWYSLLDKIDKHAPIYKVIDPIDRVIPSFVLFLLVILFLLIRPMVPAKNVMVWDTSLK